MAHYTETRPAVGGSFFAAIEGYIARLRDDRRVRREIARTYKELSALSDRELDDLGISRVDIGRISRDAVNQY